MPLISEFTTSWVGKTLVSVVDAKNALQMPVKLAVGTYPMGQVLGQFTSTTAAAEVQTLTIFGSPTGGTYTLVFDGKISSPIAHNANAAAIQTAIATMLGGTGLVNVTGTGPFTLTFAGKYANIAQPLFTVISSLTGGSSPSVAIAETTPGMAGGPYHAAYNDSLSNGLQVARCLLPYDVTVKPDGKHYWGGSDHREGTLSCSAYFSGTFRTEDLVGLDAAAVADLGRLWVGTATSGILRIG